MLGMNNLEESMQSPDSFSREPTLQTIAIEINKALRIGPVTHIKHMAVPNGQHCFYGKRFKRS